MNKPRFKVCPDCLDLTEAPAPVCGNNRQHGPHMHVWEIWHKGRLGLPGHMEKGHERCPGVPARRVCQTCKGKRVVPND